jgi:hypothetical protein
VVGRHDERRGAAARLSAATVQSQQGVTTMLARDYFHTFKDGKVHHQGQVLKVRSDGSAAVELYSWATGCANGKFVKPSSYFEGAVFYPDAESWRDEGDRLSRVAMGRG